MSTPLPHHPVIVGHRGTGRGPGENTRHAFTTAHTRGATWVELDVVATADHRLVMSHDQFHDDTPIWEHTAAGLPYEQFTPDLTTLGVGLMVEIKTVPADVDPTFTLRLLLDQVHAGHDCPLLVVSFDPLVVRACTQAGVTCGWLTKQGLPLIEAAVTVAGIGADVLIVHGPTSDVSGPRWKAAQHVLAGAHTWAWDAEPGDTTRLIGGGVTGLIGDDITGLRATLPPR